MCSSLNEAGDTEPLNSAGSPLLAEVHLLPSIGVNSALHEDSVMASLEVIIARHR